MKKSKEELLAELKAKKQKGTDSEMDKKVLKSMGVVETPPVAPIKVRPKLSDSTKSETSVTSNYSQSRELEQIANKIYNNLIDKFNSALETKGVQIVERAELKEVRYNEKNYIQKIHKLVEEGFVYAFPLVDVNDGYKQTGIMFQKLIKKSKK